MRLLVVGGAGFLGSHLVDRLLAEGHHVDVLDDLSTGALGNLAAARAAHTGALKFHHVDVRVPEIAELVARAAPDVVVHLAAPRPGTPARELVDVRVAGTVNLLDAAVGAGVDKVVVGLDALAVCGRVTPRDLPVKEGVLGAVDAVATVAERAVADLLAVYREQHALEFTALALAAVYGPRQRPDRGVVAAFLAASLAGEPCTVHGDGRQTRDLVFVDDAVDALVRATTRGSGLVVNVGTGVQTSVRDLHALVAGGGPAATYVPARVGEVGRFAVSPLRARIHLQWAPWTSLEDGIAQTREAAARA